MVKPLSIDLRERVAAALATGLTVRAAAERFGVSIASAVRLGQLQRAGHGLQARKVGGHGKPVLVGDAAAFVERRLSEKPDLTVRALAAEITESGTPVSHDTVWRFIRASGRTFKKNSAGQ